MTAAQTKKRNVLVIEDEPIHPGRHPGVQTQSADGFWNEERFTATGFPRVFYLRYHGYRKFFPLWALARYRTMKASGSVRVPFGM